MKLFIHGVPDTGYMWTPLLEALDLPKDAYLAPTLPCFDGKTPAGFPATVEAYLDWTLRFLDDVAARHGPVDIIGHDWGAALCALAAQMRPEAVRTWTVVNAVPEPSYEWHWLARAWQTPILGELVMALGSTRRFRRQLVSAGMPQALAHHEAPLIDRHMKRAILKLYRSAKRPEDGEVDFSRIADRGLALWGGDDAFVPVKFAHRFCERWSIPLAVEKGVGHWGICEKPKSFASRLTVHWNR